jgi:hypothetical protein
MLSIMSSPVQVVLEQAKRLTAQERAELVDALLRLDSDRPALDATFAALWADPARNAAEAELDRQADLEIERGGGLRGSIDDVIATIDG